MRDRSSQSTEHNIVPGPPPELLYPTWVGEGSKWPLMLAAGRRRLSSATSQRYEKRKQCERGKKPGRWLGRSSGCGYTPLTERRVSAGIRRGTRDGDPR